MAEYSNPPTRRLPTPLSMERHYQLKAAQLSWLPTLPMAAGRDVSPGDLPDQDEEEDNAEEEEEDAKLAESSFLQNFPRVLW